MSYFQDPELAKHLATAEVIIFDMNGLIVDDEPIQLQAVNEVLFPHGIQLSSQQWINQCVGRRPLEYFQEMLTGENWTTAKLQALCDDKELAYEKLIQAHVKALVRPGFLDFFNDLVKSPHHQIALATSTARQGMETILGKKGLNLMTKFDFMICGDEVSRAKPDPEIYLKARDAFPTKKHFLVFEDSAFGVQSAVASGCQCIAVPNDFTKNQDLSLATRRITNFRSNTN